MEQLTTTREERGKAIVEKSGQIQKIDEHSFTVKSHTGHGVYEVKTTDKGMTCTCSDFIKRGMPCKHILATRFYLEIQRDTPKGTVTEKVHLTYAQAWSAYNAAQTEEIKVFDALLKDLVKSIPEPEQTMGRPRMSLSENLFCAIQKVYSQLSSRRAQSLFQHAVEREQINHAPHFNTPSKLFNNPEITPILHELVTLSALPVAEMETDFAIDSTGFRTTTFSEYCGMKHGQKKKHKWIKAHMATGVKTNIVTEIVITADNVHDTKPFRTLLNGTAKNFDIKEISADKAYSSRDNPTAVAEINANAYIPFLKTARGRSHGSPLWNKMYHYFKMNQEEFMEHYHKRSNIEATNAAIKRKFGETLKSKNQIAQVNELLAKVIAYNLTVVIHEMYENGIQPSFLKI
ncbi:IS5 family transposase [Methanoregula sp.]|jgi:transposase|uniref:IS5 family transposase n=1 Tax=Methanoregula sp. TaxID=2052170 RepID=UPI003C78FC84